MLRRWQGGPCATSLQLRAHREDDTGRGGDLSGHTLPSMPATGQHNRPDRVRQFPHVGVLRISDDIAHNHATDQTGRSQTVYRAYRNTLGGIGRFHLPCRSSDSLRTIDKISFRTCIHLMWHCRVSRICIQENKKYFNR